MKTQDARWLRIRDLFEQAVELAPERREAFIDQHCGNDPELRAELKGLLASDAGATRGPLTGAIGEAVSATTNDRRQELVGTVIGPYRLSSILGHGGAGTVYLGERVDRQYSAQVAIKVVEGAALHAEIGRRFRAERQILANLNHANIARLIDAGETQQGFPYLVMEYVHGEPIDRYCDRLKLNVEQRIELMLRVCGAVQYAHQNLVVHRDIKPANILVTPDGTPKLLDFGIAKLLDTDALAAEMALTRMNDRVLTPEYASPEQILGQPVTTSSDVYALGVVLYELLTGMRPYKVSSSSQLELERTICVLEPAKPSSAVKQAVAHRQVADGKNPLTQPRTAFEASTRDIHAIADSRRVPPQKLVARLGGDVDAILLHALRKEPIYRYASVEQFAADLRRHLAREPVLARQGNWVYYARRFTRRHAVGVSATAGFIVMLTAAVIITSVQAKRIAVERDNVKREKQTSDAVAEFMTNVFTSSDPFQAQGREVTARELLDKATANINELNYEPAVKAQLLETMGNTYNRQGQPVQGVKLMEESLALRRTHTQVSDLELVPLLLRLSKAYLTNDNYTAAESALQSVLTTLETSNQTKTADYVNALNRFAELERKRGNVSEAIKYHEKVIPLAKQVYGTKHAEYALSLMNYGISSVWVSQLESALRATQEAVDIYRATEPAMNPDRIAAERLLGEILTKTGQPDEAAPILENALALERKLYGNNSTRLSRPLTLLIRLRRAQDRLSEAESLAREHLAIMQSQLGEDSLATAQARETLGIVLWRAKKLAAAENELRTALNVYRDTLPADHLYVATSEHFLAEVLLSKNELANSIAQLKLTLSRLERIKAPAWRVARSENALGQVLLQLGVKRDAEQYLIRSYEVLATSNDVDTDTVTLAYRRLESLYATEKRVEELSKLRSLHASR